MAGIRVAISASMAATLSSTVCTPPPSFASNPEDVWDKAAIISQQKKHPRGEERGGGGGG